MRRFVKHLSGILVMFLCVNVMGGTALAADSNLNYFFNPTVASAENELFVYNGSIITSPIDPGALDPSRATHYYAGNGNFSRYSSAHVCRTGIADEEPVVYDANGTPFYVQAAHDVMENRGLYVDDYYMDGEHRIEKAYARWDYIQTFVLADTRTGSLSTAYCADQTTPAVVNNYYNIQNLEDAAYYSQAQAQKVRSVALNGYWGQAEGIGSLSAMKSMLSASGQFTDEELSLLTDGVAMTATQYAIWHYTNSNTGDKRISAYNTTDSGGITRVSEEQKASVNLLFKVYEYLTSLAPQPVESTTSNAVINKDNFLTSLDVTNAVRIEGHENNVDTDESNDAYNVDVAFTMGVLPPEGNGDDLLIQIVDAKGNVLATGRIAGELHEGETLLQGSAGTYVFEDIELIEGSHSLKAKLTGYQELKQGVYLYTHENGYSASQTLVGIAQGTHTVDVEHDWQLNFHLDPERIISTQKETPDGKALAGIQFDFYYVADREGYLAGETELPEIAADYTDLPDTPDHSVITGEDGIATFDLTANNQPDGVYLVVERDHPAIVEAAEPFYAVIPGVHAEDSGPAYRVVINLENEVRDDTDIEKDVIELGNILSNENVCGEPHRWIISTAIPADIGSGRSFIVSDQLDNRLDFLSNISVTVENADGSVVAATLAEGVDYTLSVTDNNSLAEGHPSDSFAVSLTKDAMEKIAGVATAEINRIRVCFDARINTNARVGEQIPNQARMDYVNSLGINFSRQSDIPAVYTGGVRVRKVDADDNRVGLAGAEFKLYRKATDEEALAETVGKITLNGIEGPLVPVSFFNNPNLTGEMGETAYSDVEGFVYLYGLESGEYYLVETKAPTGYELYRDPIKVSVDDRSHLDVNTIVVENFGETVLPTPTPTPSPPTPTPVPTPTPPSYVPPTWFPTPPPPPRLPQTGQLNWPVPLLASAGLLFFVFGLMLFVKWRRRSDDT